MILFGANHFAGRLPDSQGWLVWDKRCGRGSSDYADCEIAWTNIDQPARLINHMWSGYSKQSERGVPREHMTQKPIAVMEWCIGQLPDGAASILDPFMGSGTTGVACQRLGRRFIGIEIDEGYFEVACRRVADAVSRPRLPLDRSSPAPTQETML